MVDDWYLAEITERRSLLDEAHSRCFQAEPWTMQAQWEVLSLCLAALATQAPEHFRLDIHGERCEFENRLSGEILRFRMWDGMTLDCQPLDLAGRHVQEDLILLAQREDDLFLDAGSVCFPANWSFPFDAGMSYTQIHSPVPYFGKHLAPKAQAFLERIQAYEQWQRLNWTMTVKRRLDTSAEKYHIWQPDSLGLDLDNVGRLVHLRVEVQKFVRLPVSNLLLFTIHTYMQPLEEIVGNPEWTSRLEAVMASLPDTVAEYKEIAHYKDLVIQYCAKQSYPSAKELVSRSN